MKKAQHRSKQVYVRIHMLEDCPPIFIITREPVLTNIPDNV